MVRRISTQAVFNLIGLLLMIAVCWLALYGLWTLVVGYQT